jgi:hypothetical protein
MPAPLLPPAKRGTLDLGACSPSRAVVGICRRARVRVGVVALVDDTGFDRRLLFIGEVVHQSERGVVEVGDPLNRLVGQDKRRHAQPTPGASVDAPRRRLMASLLRAIPNSQATAGLRRRRKRWALARTAANVSAVRSAATSGSPTRARK